MNTDKITALNNDETVSMMEPMLLSQDSRFRAELTDLAVELAQHAAGFKRSLPQGLAIALSELVRAMNCYYSNLIEGHHTHPIDIERALKNDYSLEPEKRKLQLEAAAHVEVQKWIDDGGLKQPPTAAASIREIHRRFCERLPDELLWVQDPETGEKARVVAGELRGRHVRIGRHIPINPGTLPRFLERFEERYGNLGKAEKVLASAASHHRLLWIHPFLDGNGRVARLMSYAVLKEALDTGGLWSIARGLARRESEYKAHLAACDLPRRNDLDGRGPLSEEALAEFTRFFLETCLDQVRFMEGLMKPDTLRIRILMWAEEEARTGGLPLKAGKVLEAMLYRGELERGEVPALLGTGDRHARRATAALQECGVLVSSGTRAPLRMAFPATLVSRWMPGLFPDKSS